MRGRGEIQGIDGEREEGRTLENLRWLPMTSDGLAVKNLLSAGEHDLAQNCLKRLVAPHM